VSSGYREAQNHLEKYFPAHIFSHRVSGPVGYSIARSYCHHSDMLPLFTHSPAPAQAMEVPQDQLYHLISLNQQHAYNFLSVLPAAAAVDQVFFQDYSMWTQLVRVCCRAGSLQLAQLMITKAKLDPNQRCLLSIAATGCQRTALHYAARHHTDRAVLKLLIAEYPLALFAVDCSNATPLQSALACKRPAAIISLFTTATAALKSLNFAALAAHVSGDQALLARNARPLRIASSSASRGNHSTASTTEKETPLTRPPSSAERTSFCLTTRGPRSSPSSKQRRAVCRHVNVYS